MGVLLWGVHTKRHIVSRNRMFLVTAVNFHRVHTPLCVGLTTMTHLPVNLTHSGTELLPFRVTNTHIKLYISCILDPVATLVVTRCT